MGTSLALLPKTYRMFCGGLCRDACGDEDSAGKFHWRVGGRAIGINAVGVADGDQMVIRRNVIKCRRERNNMLRAAGLGQVAAAVTG